MTPVLVSIKNSFLEVVDLSQLNYFLINGYLNIWILVLCFNNFYVAQGLIKSLLSFCPFICPSASSAFFLGIAKKVFF